MNPHVSGITLGVKDFNRAKRFYSEGLGWPIEQEQGEWVSFSLNDGSSALGLYPWDALADDAGVVADGSGFRGITLSYLVRSEERVEAVLTEAERAGGTIAKPAERAPWGGSSRRAGADGRVRDQRHRRLDATRSGGRAPCRLVREGWEVLRPHAAGVYANFLSDEDAPRVEEAYGDRLERLRALKDRYDPTNIFRLNANIRPGRDVTD